MNAATNKASKIFIQHNEGDDIGTVNQVVAYLRDMEHIFDMNSSLVKVAGDGTMEELEYWKLCDELAGRFQFFVVDKKDDKYKEKPINPPKNVIQIILSRGKRRELKQLRAITTAPYITQKGDVVDTHGYNKATQLYLHLNEDIVPVMGRCTKSDAIEAVRELQRPLKDFNFDTNLDASVALAAIFTAILRPLLKKAPGFAFDAPRQGTGKTYLAECIASIADNKAKVYTAFRTEDEASKTIIAMLRSGSRAVVLDNMVGVFDSPSVAALLTAEEFSGRKLGTSESITLPNNLLLLLTGNNLILAGDMPRRIFKCRLNSQVENPAFKKYESSALEYMQNNRQKLISSVLTIIRAYQQSDERPVNEGLASFEEWSELVRKPIAWLSTFIPGIQDPVDALKLAMESDVEEESVASLLVSLKLMFGTSSFTAKEVVTELRRDFAPSEVIEARDIIFETTASKQLTAKSVGVALAKNIDKIANGLTLKRHVRHKTSVFTVTEV